MNYELQAGDIIAEHYEVLEKKSLHGIEHALECGKQREHGKHHGHQGHQRKQCHVSQRSRLLAATFFTVFPVQELEEVPQAGIIKF